MSDAALIVPINVAALCLSPADIAASVEMMAPFADFAVLPQYNAGDGTPYIATQVMAGTGPFDGASAAVPGVHLHWALPSGLAVGVPDADGVLAFPAVPNRWQVTRFALAPGGEISQNAWIIESDRLSSASTIVVGPPQPTIPLPPDVPGSSNFAYLGLAVAQPGWIAPAPTPADFFTPLTAVGYGEESFAACYSNCSSVFGFFDNVSGVKDENAALADGTQLLYHVAGWFDGVIAADPLAAAPSTLPFSWTVASGTPGATVLSGFIGGLTWNAATQYASATAHPLSAAVGRSTPEALSALLANAIAPGAPAAAETLLNGFQLQTLGGTGQVLNQTDSSVHAAGFSVQQGGAQWALQATGNAAPGQSLAASSPLSGALNQLNGGQQLLNQALAAQAALPGRLFDLWCQYLFARYEAQYGSALTSSQLGALESLIGGVSNAASGGTDVFTQAVAMQQAAVDGLSSTVANLLSSSALNGLVALTATDNAPRYSQPNDPVLVIAGLDTKPAGRYTHGLSGASLACRMEDTLVSSVAVSDSLGNSAALTTGTPGLTALLPAAPDQAPAAIPSAVAEALLLDPVFATALIAGEGGSTNPATANQTGTQSALADALLIYLGLIPWVGGGQPIQVDGYSIAYTGAAPDPALATTTYETPWLPILMDWQVTLTPLQTVGNGSGYDPSTLNGGNFQFEADYPDLSYVAGAAPAGTAATYSGRTALSSQASASLSAALSAQIAAGTDSAATLTTLTDAQNDLRSQCILAQSMSGLMQNVLMQETTLQMPPFDPNAPHNFAANGAFSNLSTVVGVANGTASSPGAAFNPLPAGLLTVNQLRLIDVFGRVYTYGPAGDASLTVFAADALSLPTGVAGGDLFLPPRLAQPACLQWAWLDPSGQVETSGQAAANPILGIVVPGRADGGLFLYGASGVPLGALLPGGQGATFLSAPGGGLPPATPLAQAMADQPPVLADFAAALAGGTADLEGLVGAIAEAQTTILPPATPTMSSLATYVGQPLVLALASLSLSLQGPAAGDQSWAALIGLLGQEDSQQLALASAAIESLQCPVSLGMPNLLADGLVGFWLVDEGQVDFSTFYAPAGPAGSGVAVPDAGTLAVTPNGPAVQVLLLLDPRGSVAAVTGVAPVQTISIAPSQYSAAIAGLTIAMPIGPIPTGSSVGGISLPLPFLPQGKWMWAGPANGAWATAAPSDATVSPALLGAAPQALAEGWLVLTDTAGG